jgi:hypothetical protein
MLHAMSETESTTTAPQVVHHKGHEAAVARYGSTRSFVLRTLYSWLTLTMLLTFTWPLLVVYAGAPEGLSPGETPIGWFQVRLLVPLIVGAAAGWLWRVSPAPTATAKPAHALALFSRASGRVWPQVMVFLAGLCLVLGLLLVASDPAAGLKWLAFGLAEAVALQLLLSGYLNAVFELLLDALPAALATLGLFALTFAIRTTLDAGTDESLSGGTFALVALAGALLGVIVGAVSLFLRARSGSLLPAVLAQWLALYIVVGLFEG